MYLHKEVILFKFADILFPFALLAVLCLHIFLYFMQCIYLFAHCVLLHLSCSDIFLHKGFCTLFELLLEL